VKADKLIYLLAGSDALLVVFLSLCWQGTGAVLILIDTLEIVVEFAE